MGTAGMDQGMGIGMPKGIHDWRFRHAYGVVLLAWIFAPAIKNY